MSIIMEINPFDFFTDTNGDALDGGKIWIGEANKDPRQYPIIVYYDAALTIPAAMPLRTSNGYVVRNGSPTFLYVDGNYSVMVFDSKGRQIYYVPDFLMIGTGMAVSVEYLESVIDPNFQTLAELSAFAGRRPGDIVTVISIEGGWPDNAAYPFPSGGGEFVWDELSTEAPIYGILVQVTGVATGRWKRTYDGAVEVSWLGAIPDGLTECSNAVQTAFDNYESVHFGPGDWLMEFANSHSVIYTPTLITCGAYITATQKCRNLTGEGAATNIIAKTGTIYNAIISIYNVSDLSVTNLRFDGLYDNSGAAFASARIGVRFQSMQYSIVDNISAKDFSYHCLAFYGGSDLVAEPSCNHNEISNLVLDNGGQTTLLLYSALSSGLPNQNQYNNFTNITALNSHVFFGIEIRRSSNNTFTNVICNSNGKGGLNLEEGATFNKFVNIVCFFNFYALHMTSNGVANITGNIFEGFDFSNSTSHNCLAFSGAIANRFSNGRFNSSSATNGWRSEDTTSNGNIFTNVECSNNAAEGFLFQNIEFLDSCKTLNNALRGITVISGTVLRNHESRGNGTDVASIGTRAVIKCSNNNIGPKHDTWFSESHRTGYPMEAQMFSRITNAGTTILEVTEPGSISRLPFKSNATFAQFFCISSAEFVGAPYTNLDVLMRVKTDGPSRLLRDVTAGVNIAIPANTDWIYVKYSVPISSITSASNINIRYETASGFAIMDTYTLLFS